MADDLDTATDTPNIQDIAKALGDNLVSPENALILGKEFTNILQEVVKFVIFAVTVAASKAIGPIATGLMQGTNAAEGELSELAASTISGMFGISVSSSTVRGAGGEGGAGQAVGDAVLRGMGEASAPLLPSDANAKRFIAMSANVAINGWLRGFIFEILAKLGTFGVVETKAFAEITEELEGALGLGRLTRRVLTPYLNAVAIEPFRWSVNSRLRPTRLPPAMAAAQYFRGAWTKQQALEEMAIEGWSEDRSEAFINATAKHLTAADVAWMLRKGMTSPESATALLQDLGYDDTAAAQFINVQGGRAVHDVVDAHATEIGNAWVDGFVDDETLAEWLGNAEQQEDLRGQMLEVLRSRKLTPAKRMSKADIENCVTRNILSMADYRKWLAAERYDQASQDALELLLNETIRDKQDAERARAQAATEKANAAAAKAAADAQKKLDLENAQKIVNPPLSDIRQAFVRGLVPIARYEIALTAAKYPAGDVGFLLQAAQQDRDAYVAAQLKRDQAAATAAAKSLPLGSLDQAVLSGLLSVDEYARRLTAAGFVAGDVGVLVGLMNTKLAQQADALARQHAADAKLQQQGLSRADEERAVRKGIQTLAQYTAWLRAHGFSEGDAAILTATLQAELAATAAAQQLANQVNATPAAKALSLAQLETAVVAGVRPIADYNAALRKLNYTGADIDTLMALLQQKVDDAAVARAKHDQVAQQTATRSLSISQVERGVMLGTIDMAGYQDYLAQAGYGPDDVALLVDNLTLELQQARAAQAKRDQAAALLTAEGFNLGNLETDVLAGAEDLSTYRAELLARQIPPADVDVLVGVLQQQLDGQQDAADLAATVDATLKPKALSLAQWTAAVVDGTRTVADFGAFLQGQGYSLADAQVLMTAAAEKIPAAPSTPAS